MYGIYQGAVLLFNADSLDDAAHIIDVARDENTIDRRAAIIAVGGDGRHVYTDHWEQEHG